MRKVLELVFKYIGLPLLKELGEGLMDYVRDYFAKRKIKKDQKAKQKAVEDAKTPEEIRAAHRNNQL